MVQSRPFLQQKVFIHEMRSRDLNFFVSRFLTKRESHRTGLSCSQLETETGGRWVASLRTAAASTTLAPTSLLFQRWMITSRTLMARNGVAIERKAIKSHESRPLTRMPMLRFDSIADLGPWVFTETTGSFFQSLRGGIKWHWVDDWVVEF